ncbi:MAG TPA: sugar transferase [Gemmatimonadaceae bacterium]|nr:sugar transferase [Gemmatimonadaceae bacterium]
MRYEVLKRSLDVFVSGALLILLSPVLLLVALLILIVMGRPVLFRQLRPGLNGEPFILNKFRTMTRSNSTELSTAPDDIRLNALGRFLRRASLDELPQLWNVLVGDMSLVGPRPLLMEYMPLYSTDQARRHAVRPGITGWAQVNGRNAISWQDKFRLDLWYVNHQSLSLDIKILWMTVVKVLRRDGITQAGHVTTEKFMGN